jgi:hypothetical protein
MAEVHRLFDGGQEVERLQRNFSSEGVREVVLHPFQDAVDPARVLLVNHRFGVLQAIRPIRHQPLIFREPRLELDKISSVILARRAAYYATEMKTRYGGNGIFVVFEIKHIDAFKTRQRRKVVGVLNVVARADTGEYTKDFEGAEDLGSRKEDETAVLNIVRKGITNGSDAGIMFPAVEPCSLGNSKLVAIVTDSAKLKRFFKGNSFKRTAWCYTGRLLRT